MNISSFLLQYKQCWVDYLQIVDLKLHDEHEHNLDYTFGNVVWLLFDYF